MLLSVFDDAAGGDPLLAAFWAALHAEYLAGQYPSPPVDPFGESLPGIPLRIHEGDDSSMEDMFDEMSDDEDDELGADGEGGVAGAVGAAGLGQGGAGAPAVYGLVVEGLRAMAAGAGGPAVAVNDEETSDMEDLF